MAAIRRCGGYCSISDSRVIHLGCRIATAPVAADKQTEPPKEEAKPTLDSGDTAWMLVSTGLVLLMVPGLALFYGGMVRRKNVLGTMMHSMVALAIDRRPLGAVRLLRWRSATRTAAGSAGAPDFLGLQRRDARRRSSPAPRSRSTSTACTRACSPSSRRRSSAAPSPSASASGRTACSSCSGRRWSTTRWPTGSGPVRQRTTRKPDPSAGSARWARSTSPAARSSTSRPASPRLAAILVLRKRRGYPEHAMHPNSMVLTLTGRRPALVRLVRLQRRQRPGSERPGRRRPSPPRRWRRRRRR